MASRIENYGLISHMRGSASSRGSGTVTTCHGCGRFLNAVAGAPDQLQIMYGIDGERRLSEFEAPWLPGYEDSRPVREQLFERLLGLRNDLGLLSEEFEPRSGRLVGNFPQAFSHLGLVRRPCARG